MRNHIAASWYACHVNEIRTIAIEIASDATATIANRVEYWTRLMQIQVA